MKIPVTNRLPRGRGACSALPLRRPLKAILTTCKHALRILLTLSCLKSCSESSVGRKTLQRDKCGRCVSPQQLPVTVFCSPNSLATRVAFHEQSGRLVFMLSVGSHSFRCGSGSLWQRDKHPRQVNLRTKLVTLLQNPCD